MYLREYLISENKSEKTAAFELDVPQPVLNRWITGARIPRQENMQKIIAYTGGLVTPNDFYKMDEAINNQQEEGEEK